jgi:hypothetical protein
LLLQGEITVHLPYRCINDIIGLCPARRDYDFKENCTVRYSVKREKFNTSAAELGSAALVFAHSRTISLSKVSIFAIRWGGVD